MSWTIAISNQKGGVGKTTTCISLGACLAEMGNRILIVDLDSQANLTMSAGFDPDSLEWAIPDLLEPEDETIDSSNFVIPTSYEDLHILPSDVRLAAVEQSLYQKPEYEKTLKDGLSRWSSKYDVILIDCPPSLGALTLMGLTAADIVLVPVQCEYFSARGLMRLIDVMDAVKKHTNPDIDYLLVVTLFDKRNRISRQVLDQLKQTLSSKFLSTIIGIDTKLRESAVAGEPIIVYSPQSRASRYYRQLARELVNELNSRGARDEKAKKARRRS